MKSIRIHGYTILGHLCDTPPNDSSALGPYASFELRSHSTNVALLSHQALLFFLNALGSTLSFNSFEFLYTGYFYTVEGQVRG